MESQMHFLEKFHIVHSWTGFIHTLLAIISLFIGSAVLLRKKGTASHKKLGYTFVTCMVIMNVSGFGINSFGGFSVFHALALVSLATVALGVAAAWRRKKGWYTRHFYFMSWSVVGLYCAFWAETGVRLFDMRFFWWVVMIASTLTAVIGAFVINREARKLNLR